MAEAPKKKGKKTLDDFADDLDSMLNVDDANDSQVGLIDDDDAIDRLLVGDAFSDDEVESENDMLGDIDKLIADQPPAKTMASTIDEFGDDESDIDALIAGLAINPKQDETVEVAAIENLPEVELELDEVDLSALESVGLIDDFAETPVVAAAPKAPDPVAVTPAPVELDSLSEIDEFSDEPVMASSDHADFLLADFDISADDPGDMAVSASQAIPVIQEEASEPMPQELAFTEIESAVVADAFAEDVLLDDEVDLAEQVSAVAVAEPDVVVTPPAVGVSPAPQSSMAPPVDYSPEIARLTHQIEDLKKQLKQTKHDIQLKVEQAELNSCLEAVENLQTEQRKAKRSLEAMTNQKPVAAYVANGVAAVAFLIAAGMAVEVFITQSQVGELVTMTGQLKQQIEMAPAKEAADEGLLRKQLDELSVAQSVASTQLAELSKALHGNSGGAAPGATQPVGDFGKALGDLSNQDMQMGAAIEALQTKVAALEKGRQAVAPVKPATPKKPVVVEENWQVNLIAFKQDWYAKRKAEEFAGKGVPAKVSRSDGKGETWYRLSVDGFKSQYEAASYAAKIKKSLNLDSVSVSKEKN